MLGLYVAGITFVSSMGPTSALIIAIMVATTLTVVPAPLAVTGIRVNPLRLRAMGCS